MVRREGAWHSVDAYVEGLCEPLDREDGHPAIPPGGHFRMLFIGYFEGIDSQRGIAWRRAADAVKPVGR